MGDIVIADYGVGNLLSLARALEAVGAQPVRTSDPEKIAAADRLILPGVGAFGHCAEHLRRSGMDDAVKAQTSSGRPFLGICVGMQLMLERGLEYGEHEGLGFIPGTVERIVPQEEASVRVPHIGWNTIDPDEHASWDGTILEDVEKGAFVYFVHSFAAYPASPEDCLSITTYDGFRIVAAVRCANMTGVQFHPEKSGAIGLRILSAFATFST